MSRVEFERIDLCNYLSTGQSAGRITVGTRTWSVSKCSRNHASQYELFVPVSGLHTFNWLYCYWQIPVCIVVSAIAAVVLFSDLITDANRLQIQTVDDPTSLSSIAGHHSPVLGLQRCLLGAKTIKKNSTQNKTQTQRARAYEVTSFLSRDCELSTETCSKNVYSPGPWCPSRCNLKCGPLLRLFPFYRKQSIMYREVTPPVQCTHTIRIAFALQQQFLWMPLHMLCYYY